MTKQIFLGSLVKRFLLEYVISIKNLSQNTQQSYRDVFRVCLPYVANKSNKSVDELTIEDMPSECIKDFLFDLEIRRQCCLTTRNQRLAVIHAFAQFVGLYYPEYVEWCHQIRLIPYKKTEKSLVTYLEKSEMDALLNAPDRSTDQGNRDYALLLFLYNTGTRADEAAQLKIADLDIARNPKKGLSSVTVKGKGNKVRRCPLWRHTIKALTELISGRGGIEHVFLNRYREPITRFGIHRMVKRYVNKIVADFPSLAKKQISPHTIRHTTATHLLRAGVDINTIRVWLGHVSLNTTNIYAEVDLEMRTKALALCEVTSKKSKKYWHDDKKTMEFLNSI